MTELAYFWIRHPRSGELYAAQAERLGPVSYGRIIRAVGPLPQNAALTAFAQDVILNAASDAEALDDGAWLDSEIA